MRNPTSDYDVRTKSIDEHDVGLATRDGMSPLIRELIIAYSGWDGERAWDPAAFDRRRPQIRLMRASGTS